MRIVPGADADHELELLVAHLRSVAPWNVAGRGHAAQGGLAVCCRHGGRGGQGRGGRAAPRPSAPRWSHIGSGGSIPLINSLKNACPRADVILWGAEDTKLSRIHASNECVDPAEIERMVVAQVLTLQQLGSSSGSA